MALRDPDKTRTNLLTIAAGLFRHKGYNGTSLSDIINEANVSKGALYHHFSNKQELLYAVVDELYRAHYLAPWQSVVAAEDPIEAIVEALEELSENVSDEDMCHGCPVHNVLAELGATDEGLRTRINNMQCDVKSLISDALERAKSLGLVAADVESNQVALFFMCGINGMPQLVTSCQNKKEVFEQLTAALSDYIRSFKIVS